MPPDKLQKLKELVTLLQNDTIRPQEISQFLSVIIGALKQSTDNFKTLSGENIQEIKNALSYILVEHNQVLKEIDSKNKDLEKAFNSKLVEAEKLLVDIRATRPADGINGQDGIDGVNPDPQEVADLVLNDLEIPEIEGTEIVDKVNELPVNPENQIDAKHIKNLPKYERPIIASPHYLAGDNITINGNVISSTGGGSGGSSLSYETPPETPNGNPGQTFTFQNLPINITADNQTYFEGTGAQGSKGYTITGSGPYTVTMDNGIWNYIEGAYNNSTGTTTTFVSNEIASGSGTSFTLAHTPVVGSVKVYGQRSRLYPGTVPTDDYSISGANITTTLTYSLGDLICDYQY